MSSVKAFGGGFWSLCIAGSVRPVEIQTIGDRAEFNEWKLKTRPTNEMCKCFVWESLC